MITQMENPRNIGEKPFVRLGHLLTRSAFGLVVMIFLAAPILALSWRNIPFPGFVVEQTLVVNQDSSEGWSGLSAGIKPGQQIIRIGDIPVNSPEDYRIALSSFKTGEKVSIFVTRRDGMGGLYPSITLAQYPIQDSIRFFWLPYLVGLIYLGIGVWIYRARGSAFSGLALAIFCLLTSVICALIFDLSTTHLLVRIWIVATSMCGAALISLAMCFPLEWQILRKRQWILATPYLVSFVLIIWNMIVLYDHNNPWAYYESWGASYRYLALGILFFLSGLIFHIGKRFPIVVQRQSRIVLLGSVLAFLPILVWFLTPIFHINVPFSASIFLLPLILFPLSIAIAILRFRLLEIDQLVNRTLVYGALTAILAGIFTAMIALSQKVFIALTGEKSDAAIVITTLIVGSAIAPVKARIQEFVDRQFKGIPEHTKDLKIFGDQVKSFVEMSSVHQLTMRLLVEAAEALHADNGAIALVDGNPAKPTILHTYHQWKGDALISLPVEAANHRYGFLLLGPRVDGRPYTREEFGIVKDVSDSIAEAIRLSEREPITDMH